MLVYGKFKINKLVIDSTAFRGQNPERPTIVREVFIEQSKLKMRHKNLF